MEHKISIPEHLARAHASVRDGKTASQSAREIGEYFSRTIVECAGVKAGERLLDIGCGPGRMAIGLAELFRGDLHYHGFDINAEDIGFAQREITRAYPSFHFTHLNIRNDYYNKQGEIDPLSVRFPVDNGWADVAVASSLFTHMFTDETLRYFDECALAIRPGGVLFATFFLLDDEVLARQSAWSRKFKGFTPIDEHAFTATPHAPGKVVAFQKNFIVASLEAAGFTVEKHLLGAWSGALGAKHSQDDIIARRR